MIQEQYMSFYLAAALFQPLTQLYHRNKCLNLGLNLEIVRAARFWKHSGGFVLWIDWISMHEKKTKPLNPCNAAASRAPNRRVQLNENSKHYTCCWWCHRSVDPDAQNEQEGQNDVICSFSPYAWEIWTWLCSPVSLCLSVIAGLFPKTYCVRKPLPSWNAVYQGQKKKINIPFYQSVKCLCVTWLLILLSPLEHQSIFCLSQQLKALSTRFVCSPVWF